MDRGKIYQSCLNLLFIDKEKLHNDFDIRSKSVRLFENFKRENFVNSCKGLSQQEVLLYITWVDRTILNLIWSSKKEFLEEHYEDLYDMRIFTSKAINYVRLRETGNIPPKDENEQDLLETLFIMINCNN